MRVSSSYSSLEGYTNRVGVLFLDFLKVIKSTILSCHKVIPSSGFQKSCKLDPLPATTMRSCYSVLVPVFKTVINLSLSTGSMPEDFKMASLRPLLKKPNADCEKFSNFRPVSNLKFLSKLVEKTVFVQLNNYFTVNGHGFARKFSICVQSAPQYKDRTANDHR